MSFKDVEIKNSYRSFSDNIPKDFYIPVLKESILYRRSVGFFSSTALIEISKGITGLIGNGGKIELIASPNLSEEDIEAINTGYDIRRKIEESIESNFVEPQTQFGEDRLNLLAHLVAENKLEIKIAVVKKSGNYGMYHEKVGLLYDEEENIIVFNGSMNESITAYSHNYESIDVFCSWSDVDGRVQEKEQVFQDIWEDKEEYLKTYDFTDLTKELLLKYKKNTVNYDIDKEQYIVNDESEKYNIKPQIPENIKLYDYQLEAIKNWKENKYRGIFDMATGTGKTYTALGAIAMLCKEIEGTITIIIVCPFQHLVEQWVEDIRKFNMNPIIGYSKSPQKNWKKMLSDEIRKQNLAIKGSEFILFICTNSTFKSEGIQNEIARIRGEILIVADEAHNFGAENMRKLLSKKYTYRLALSATFERHNDEEGTKSIYDFFEKKCINYKLKQAIKEGKLTPYKYYPVLNVLEEEERQAYCELSYEMSKNLITNKSGKTKLNKYGEILAIKRARIVAAAKNKIHALGEKVKSYRNDTHMLVYCGSASIFDNLKEYTEIDENELRQIDVVTNMLGNKLGMKVSQFTSKEDINERKLLKKEFEKGENIQVLIAIKCLDEGVNIPQIKTAFILASTTNPKEYIQRRGRILRLSEGKVFSTIYDFVTLPRKLKDVYNLTVEELKQDYSLVKNEIKRMEEFCEISMNPMKAKELIREIKNAYKLDQIDKIK